MAAAIKASLQETLKAEEEDNTDIETFSDEDSNLGFSSHKGENGGGEKTKQVENCSNVNGSDEVVTNGNDRLIDNDNHDNQDEDESEWKKYLGPDTDPVANVVIRFPDGSRDSWKYPSSSRLKALVMFVKSKGYSLDDHEIVTNFPRRVITDLELTSTVKEAGLFPQETVFVQLKD